MIRANLPPFDNIDEIDFRSDTKPPHTVIEELGYRGVSCGSTDNTNCTATDGKPHPDNGVGKVKMETTKEDVLSMTHQVFPNPPVPDVGDSVNIDPGSIIVKEVKNVEHPSHYNFGKIEVIDFIEDQKLGFHLGNAIKYICRAGKKDPKKTREDLDKAIWYINRYKRTIEEKTAD